ncbi:(2Fe-2S)-binding protein [Clostridium sp. JNZ J1-5]
MEQNISSEILDKLTKVCICKSVDRARIKKSIKAGADTFEKVQKATGAGTGPCGAKRCRCKIEDLIKESK